MRRNYFILRVLKFWNSLPKTAVEAKLFSTFKSVINDTYTYENIFIHGDGTVN